MTKDECIKAHCEMCNIQDCGWRTRGMQCSEIDLIEDTWDMCQESVVDKACNIIGKSIREWNWHYRFNEFYINEDATVAKFKKTMED